MPDIPQGIPEWVFWISTAFGTGLGALIVRLGWRTAGKPPDPPKQEGTAYIDRVGVLVDNTTIQTLSGSIEGLGLELLTMRKQYKDESEEQCRVGERLVDELKELRTDIRELARAWRNHPG